jgi:predicted PurR-regulated permease PerM
MGEGVTTGEWAPGTTSTRSSVPSLGDGAAAEFERYRLRVEGLERRVADLQAERDSGALSAPRRELVIGPRAVLLVLCLTGAVALGAGLVYFAWQGLSLILIAVLFAVALSPGVEFFVRRGWRRGTAVLAVFVCGLLLVAGAVAIAVPALVDQVGRFADGLPALAQGHGPLGFLERKYQVVEHARHTVLAGDSAVGVVLGVASTALSGMVIAFLTFFMLLEGPIWVERLLRLAPQPVRPRVERVAAGVSRTVSGFVTGNVLTAAIAGVVATLALSLVGVPYAVPIGVFVGILDLLPIVGAILILTLVGLVSLTKGLLPTLIVVGILFVYHQIEVYYLRPVIYGRTIELSPLAVLATVVIGTEMAGLLGAVAAIPIAGTIQVVIAEIADHRACSRRDSRVVAANGDAPLATR